MSDEKHVGVNFFIQADTSYKKSVNYDVVLLGEDEIATTVMNLWESKFGVSVDDVSDAVSSPGLVIRATGTDHQHRQIRGWMAGSGPKKRGLERKTRSDKVVKVTNFFEQANAAIPLFAEMCKRAKFANHDEYLTLELETDDSPEGKLICFAEAGDSMYELLMKTAIEWGEG